jgi:hypothetical protein
MSAIHIPAIYDPADGRDLTDPLHPVVHLDGKLHSSVDFDFGCLDPPTEDQIAWQTVRSGFWQIIQWITSAQDFVGAGARAHSLATVLNPIDNRFRNLSAVSRASGVHRATLDKSLLDLFDRFDIRLCIGKFSSSRQKFAEAQNAAVRRGTHSSFRRNGAKAPSQEGKMNQSVKTRYPTLDKATDRIAELEQKLVSQSTKAAVSPKPQNQPTQSTATAPKLGDLSVPELKEALDIANREHDTAMVATLYGELNRRRGK